MNSQDLETLSAMLDSEASELEIRRVLNAIEGDPDIAEAWKRMSLVQAVLHDDNIRDSRHLYAAGSSFTASVAQAIAGEPVPTTLGREDGSPVRWSLPLAKIAIAASVALAFFLGMQTTINAPTSNIAAPVAQQQTGQPDAAEALTSPDPTLLAGAEEVINTAEREVDPEARQRLEEYIRSVSITRDEPQQFEQLEDSPLYRLVNEIQDQK